MEKGHMFHWAPQRPMAFAELWEICHADDQAIVSCTMLTTLPNELVQSVGHHRMPVLLSGPEQGHDGWTLR